MYYVYEHNDSYLRTIWIKNTQYKFATFCPPVAVCLSLHHPEAAEGFSSTAAV